MKSSYDTKVSNLELKIPDISGLLQTSTFNSKVSELENKIKTAESKPNIKMLKINVNIKNLIPNSYAFVKKTDYATEISSMNNDYVTNVALASQLNDLKSQHIADEVKMLMIKLKIISLIFWVLILD